MLSDSPPERDVEWTEAGIEGAGPLRPARLAPGRRGQALARRCRPPAPRRMAETAAMRRAAQAGPRALEAVGESIAGLRFNRAVAMIYELANAISASLAILPQQRQDAADHALGAALRESLEILVADDGADDAASGRGMLGGARQ